MKQLVLTNINGKRERDVEMIMIEKIANQNLFIVGGVGTGKSSLIARILQEKRKVSDFSIGVMGSEIDGKEYKEGFNEDNYEFIDIVNNNPIYAFNKFISMNINTIVIDEFQIIERALDNDIIQKFVETIIQRNIQLIIATHDSVLTETLKILNYTKLVVGKSSNHLSNKFKQFKDINLYEFFYIDNIGNVANMQKIGN